MNRFRGHLAVTVTGGLEEVVTPWAGATVLIETYRGCGVSDAAERALPITAPARIHGLRPNLHLPASHHLVYNI